MEFAKDFSMPPWEVYERVSENWWGWWKLYRSELSKYEKTKK